MKTSIAKFFALLVGFSVSLSPAHADQPPRPQNPLGVSLCIGALTAHDPKSALSQQDLGYLYDALNVVNQAANLPKQKGFGKLEIPSWFDGLSIENERQKMPSFVVKDFNTLQMNSENLARLEFSKYTVEGLLVDSTKPGEVILSGNAMVGREEILEYLSLLMSESLRADQIFTPARDSQFPDYNPTMTGAASFISLATASALSVIWTHPELLSDPRFWGIASTTLLVRRLISESMQYNLGHFSRKQRIKFQDNYDEFRIRSVADFMRDISGILNSDSAGSNYFGHVHQHLSLSSDAKPIIEQAVRSGKDISSEDANQIVQNNFDPMAQDVLKKNFYLDMIFYPDSVTGEPVLLSFVRWSSKPIGRPPKKPKEESTASQEEFGLGGFGVPGGPIPKPIRVPAR